MHTPNWKRSCRIDLFNKIARLIFHEIFHETCLRVSSFHPPTSIDLVDFKGGVKRPHTPQWLGVLGYLDLFLPSRDHTVHCGKPLSTLGPISDLKLKKSREKSALPSPERTTVTIYPCSTRASPGLRGFDHQITK